MVSFEFLLVLAYAVYRVSHPIMQRGFSDYFLGVPPSCGSLLQLATAQAGQGNSQKLIWKNSLHDGMRNSVSEWAATQRRALIALHLTYCKLAPARDQTEVLSAIWLEHATKALLQVAPILVHYIMVPLPAWLSTHSRSLTLRSKTIFELCRPSERERLGCLKRRKMPHSTLHWKQHFKAFFQMCNLIVKIV